MNISSQIAAATAERNRIEAAVWNRHPSMERRDDLLPYLLTADELAHWRAICAAIVEMSKHVRAV